MAEFKVGDKVRATEAGIEAYKKLADLRGRIGTVVEVWPSKFHLTYPYDVDFGTPSDPLPMEPKEIEAVTVAVPFSE